MKYFLYAYVISLVYNAFSGIYYHRNWMKHPDNIDDSDVEKNLATTVIVMAFSALSIIPFINMLATAILFSMHCAGTILQGLAAYRKNQREQILK